MDYEPLARSQREDQELAAILTKEKAYNSGK